MTTEPERDLELENLLTQVYHKGITTFHKFRRAQQVNRLGRNDRCICDSGKKVKQCCGKASLEPQISKYGIQLAKMDRVLGFGTKGILQ